IDDGALAAFSGKKNIRVLACGPLAAPGQAVQHKQVGGGMLIQSGDSPVLADDDLTVVTTRAPSAEETADLRFAWTEAGIRAVIQPGGSIRDEEVVAAANEAGMAMVFTGVRHFRH
ncbi:MAG: hypothetical protein ACPF9T_09660, partial [Pseudomonadales bacterium]